MVANKNKGCPLAPLVSRVSRHPKQFITMNKWTKVHVNEPVDCY